MNIFPVFVRFRTVFLGIFGLFWGFDSDCCRGKGRGCGRWLCHGGCGGGGGGPGGDVLGMSGWGGGGRGGGGGGGEGVGLRRGRS